MYLTCNLSFDFGPSPTWNHEGFDDIYCSLPPDGDGSAWLHCRGISHVVLLVRSVRFQFLCGHAALLSELFGELQQLSACSPAGDELMLVTRISLSLVWGIKFPATMFVIIRKRIKSLSEEKDAPRLLSHHHQKMSTNNSSDLCRGVVCRHFLKVRTVKVAFYWLTVQIWYIGSFAHCYSWPSTLAEILMF